VYGGSGEDIPTLGKRQFPDQGTNGDRHYVGDEVEKRLKGEQ